MSKNIETFTLVKERLLLGNINIRTEMHGDERVSAVDIAFSFDSANNILSKLHPDLRATFYHAADTKDLADADHMPHLRFPLMQGVKWELEIPRTRLCFHDIDGRDIVLGGGRTNKFHLDMKEGGTVSWKFRCQFSEPEAEKIAGLMGVLNQKIPVSLECVDEEEEGDNFDQVEQLSASGKTPSAARLAADDMFKAPPDKMPESAGFDTPPDDPDFEEVATAE
jgi:hypothetical protein